MALCFIGLTGFGRPQQTGDESRMKLGVIDVGGGMRGMYATGVLDRCLDEKIRFDYCIGVSAGSANLASYLAGQKGRNKQFYGEYARRRAYMGLGNFLRKGCFIDMDYVYGVLSNSDGESPLGYTAIVENPADFIVVAENAVTGESKYFTKEDMAQDDYRILMASSSIPGVNRPYVVDGTPYFDGALGDPVPIAKAFADGCDKVVLILTRPAEEPRSPKKDEKLAGLIRRTYPISAEKLRNRAARYNASVELARQYAEKGRVLIISPDSIKGVSTLSRGKEAGEAFYRKGVRDAQAIVDWLKP